MNFDDFVIKFTNSKQMLYEDFNFLRNLLNERKFYKIKILSEIQRKYNDCNMIFVEAAIISNDLEQLRNLSQRNITHFYETILNKLNLKTSQILFYPKNKITENTIRIFQNSRNFILENCDYFDQFLSYNPTKENMADIIRFSSSVNIDNWCKICYNYSECFELINDRSLNFINSDELILHLISIGYGRKINPLIHLNTKLIFENWYYLDMDKFFSNWRYFGNRTDFKLEKIFTEKPEIVFNICSNIILNSKFKSCFSERKRALENIFSKMNEANRNIFRNLVINSNFNDSRKKYLLNRTFFRSI